MNRQYENRVKTWFAENPVSESIASVPNHLELRKIKKWIQNNPQLAFIGAVVLGASLGWMIKERQ